MEMFKMWKGSLQNGPCTSLENTQSGGEMMKVLYLPMKKKWFDMVFSGEKTEDYRRIYEMP